MYFCSGPPRTYALPADAARDRVEDVAVAVDPFYRVVARVTSARVTLWTASARGRAFHAQRLLLTLPRSGRFVDGAAAVAAAGVSDQADTDNGLADGGCVDVQQLWVVWLSGDRLAVVERGSQFVEFYAFTGLPAAQAGNPLQHPPSAADSDAHGSSGAVSPTGVQVAGRFIGDYALRQGDSKRDQQDVAWSMSGVAGGKYLFVGMETGLVCVIEVSDAARFNAANSHLTTLWKIDVLSHLTPPDGADNQPPSCYSVTAATWESATRVTMLYLVASFEGGKCFIMLISPAVKCIEQLLSLVNTERDASSSCFGRCTTVALDPNGSRLALGWSDGGVSLFRLAVKFQAPSDSAAGTSASPTLQLEPLKELSMMHWGYATKDIGGVTALAWTHDARALAVGYELRGFAVFSMDGCRLMSSLPQHNHERAEGSDEQSAKEVCPYGALRLAWSAESTSLLVVSRGEQFEIPVAQLPQQSSAIEASTNNTEVQPPPTLSVNDLFERIDVELFKEADGLCLSLSGAPGRCGAWVRSESSFTLRRDGGIGPAEASNRIDGGDLLIAIDGDDEVVNLPFEQIIGTIKTLANDTTVTLSFMRLKWDKVYPLMVQGLSSRDFMDFHGIQLLEEEDLCIREYSLRMQELHGDCDLEERPPMLELERRAKFDGWEAIQGTSKTVARHRYIKLFFALFPVWNPIHVLQVLLEFCEANASHILTRPPSPRKMRTLSDHPAMEPRRRRSRLAFSEYDFARSVPLSGKSSKLILLEDATIRAMPTPSLDDPCALVSSQSWRVPSEYESKCCPLRIAAVSASGNQFAVAGQKGFCLLNLSTGKWRMFGNVHEEQDMFVYSLLWIHEDAILASFTRHSEQHKIIHLKAYPRNHLDEESVLSSLEIPRDSSTSSNVADDANDDCFFTMESDEEELNVFCLSRKELWCIGIEYSGSIKEKDLVLQLTLKREVKLPSRILESNRGHVYGVMDFTVLPRVLHIQDEERKKQREERYRAEREAESEGGGWLSSIVNLIAGGEVPDQYKPEEVLPRFAFLDVLGNAIVWDPENRSQRLVCSNVTTMTRVFVTHEASPSWPTPCRLIYGLYGPEGMKMWLPLLDGVYLSHTKAFEQDEERLETFLACHDPLRAKTYEIEFGTAPATAELYEQVVREYGIDLENFYKSKDHNPRLLDDGIKNLRGCIMTVDDPSSKDVMLRFDSDVKLLGIHQASGLLIGISQDVYMPSGFTLPCYDVFSRVQPLFHAVLCFLVATEQLSWARLVLDAVRNHYALSSPTQEHFLHSMLELCFSKQITKARFKQAIQLLQPSSRRKSTGVQVQVSGAEDAEHTGQGDIDEYCEIVAHVARKSEPSRLKLLFPLVGDPLELLAICRQRGELRTAANFLLILEECSSTAAASSSTNLLEMADGQNSSNLAFRSACAAELVAQCIEHEEWALAKQVVRVARDWEHPDESRGGDFMDEQLSKFAWNDLVSGQYERVVWCVEELQARLPEIKGLDIGFSDQQEFRAVSQRLRDIFIASNKQRELRILLEAVTLAKYEQWASAILQVLEDGTM